MSNKFPLGEIILYGEVNMWQEVQKLKSASQLWVIYVLDLLINTLKPFIFERMASCVEILNLKLA